ncbi:MAG: tryptophan 7-halogenase [Gammaproteobacteria bacterium]|nr:tryptophan 7-halogenase [Gammaproteobacteria bacterium]
MHDHLNRLRIVVLGGGTAGWMAANLMAHRWRERNVEITVLESPEIGIVGVGEGSTPQLKAFFDTLEIPEAQWMPVCGATYKNGIRFCGWSRQPGFDSYFHPFLSAIDQHTEPAFFLNCSLRRGGFDVPAHPDRFFLAAELARKRLAPLPAHHFPFFVSYGYHFDARVLGAFLCRHALQLGVRHLQGKVRQVRLAGNGDVAALETEDGRVLEADLFVDSTGFRALILQQALGVAFRAFADNLFNDAAVTLPTPPAPDGVRCNTTATALDCGWVWDIPLRDRTGNGYVYSTAFCSPDAAERELRAHLGMLDAPVQARHLKMRVGRVERHWCRNCLAVGLSQGFIEPLEATALHLVLATVDGFMDAFEASGFDPAGQTAFNAAINRRFDGVRDYIVCHYRMNRCRDTEYWRANAEHHHLSDSLKAILTCWFTGRDLRQEIERQGIGDIYPPLSWHCLLAGYGQFPDPAKLRRDPQADARVNLAAVDDFVSRCALNFSSHGAALATR